MRKGEAPCIYTLSDSTGIRYVGQTKSPKRREWQHKSYSNNQSNRAVCNWIISLLNKAESPVFTVIEETNDLDAREMYWIKYFIEKGVSLLNHNKGGKDISHALKAKKDRPWGFSPVQKIMTLMRSSAKIQEKYGRIEARDKILGYIKFHNDRFKKFPWLRDHINMKLWEKQQLNAKIYG